MALRRSMLVGTIRGCSYVDIRAYSCLSVCVVVLLSMYIAQIHIIHLLQYFNLRLMRSAQQCRVLVCAKQIAQDQLNDLGHFWGSCRVTLDLGIRLTQGPCKALQDLFSVYFTKDSIPFFDGKRDRCPRSLNCQHHQ